jgi:hypothetical protein
MSKLSQNKKIDLKTDKTVKFLIGILTALVITAMFPHHESFDSEYSVGMIWAKEDLIAPFSFPIYKSEQVYTKEVEEAKSKVLPVFGINTDKDSVKSPLAGFAWTVFFKIKRLLITKKS